MDKIIKMQVQNSDVRLTYVDVTECCQKAQKIHNLSNLSAYALGKTLNVCAFMSAGLKSEIDRLTLTVKSNTNGMIIATGNSNLHLRGFMDNVSLQKEEGVSEDISLARAVNSGRITVIRSMGLKEPYTGSANISDGNIYDDFRDYFEFSEQQPTEIIKIGSGYSYKAIYLQCYPSVPVSVMEEVIVTVRENAQRIADSANVYNTLTQIFNVEGNEYTPEYKCNCSRNYFANVLHGLGKEELYDIIKEQGQIKINCQFCQSDYVFTKEDVDKIINNEW